MSKASDNYCTPLWLVQKVANIFKGTIDLDPCCNKFSYTTNEEYKCTCFIENFGYSPMDIYDKFIPKNCNIYINPPYSDCKPWIELAIKSYENLDCNVIVLVNSMTATKWYQDLLFSSSAMVLFNKRINFEYEKNPTNRNLYCQTIFILTKSVYGKTSSILSLFYDEFKKYGKHIDLK